MMDEGNGWHRVTRVIMSRDPDLARFLAVLLERGRLGGDDLDVAADRVLRAVWADPVLRERFLHCLEAAEQEEG